MSNITYGAGRDRRRFYASMRFPHLNEPIVGTYTVAYTDWNDALYNVQSNIECIPHLLIWGEDKVQHKGKVLNWVVKKTLAPYLQNMNDDELKMVEPTLTYIAAFGKVLRIQSFSHSVELCVEINGVQRTLLLTVMNMMEHSSDDLGELTDYHHRWTLN